MKIAIASGKGGTGKSTVSTNLAYLLAKSEKNICLIDCDVEEPNCHIFIKPQIEQIKKIHMPVPQIDEEKCIKCGKCAEICQFNALAFIKGSVIKFPELCHGCQNCKIGCPVSAIYDGQREIGQIQSGSGKNINFIHGILRIGEAMSPPLIKAIKKESLGKDFDIEIFDCPPGTSCPAISAIKDSDYVLMVTEPTPFGLYDLKLAVDVVKKMKLNFGIVINRSSKNDSMIEEYAKKEQIKIMTKIPDSIEIAKCYSAGNLVAEKLPEYNKYFQPLVKLIEEKTKQ